MGEAWPFIVSLLMVSNQGGLFRRALPGSLLSPIRLRLSSICRAHETLWRYHSASRPSHSRSTPETLGPRPAPLPHFLHPRAGVGLPSRGHPLRAEKSPADAGLVCSKG